MLQPLSESLLLVWEMRNAIIWIRNLIICHYTLKQISTYDHMFGNVEKTFYLEVFSWPFSWRCRINFFMFRKILPPDDTTAKLPWNMWNGTVFADCQAVCLGKLLALAFFYCHCTLHSTLRGEGSKIAQMNNICTDSSQDVNRTELLSNEKDDDHFRKQNLHLQNKLSRRLPLFTRCSRAAVSSNSFYFPSICGICL